MDNHYQMLGIARSATALEIKTAFQTKMKALEASDVHGERRETQEKLLQQAFLTLLDPGRRAKYDKQIDTPVRRPVARRDEATGVSVPTVVFVGALLAAIMAGGWYMKHSAQKRQEAERQQEEERIRAIRAKSEANKQEALKKAAERDELARAEAAAKAAQKAAAGKAAKREVKPGGVRR